MSIIESFIYVWDGFQNNTLNKTSIICTYFGIDIAKLNVKNTLFFFWPSEFYTTETVPVYTTAHKLTYDNMIVRRPNQINYAL